MKGGARITRMVAVGVTGLAGAVAALFHHRAACYGSHLAPGDWQYGWPFRYGFDQDDVVGELLWTLASFRRATFAADAAIGFALGLAGGLAVLGCADALVARCTHTVGRPRPTTAGLLVTSLVTIASLALVVRPQPSAGAQMVLRVQMERIVEGLVAFRDQQGRYPRADEGLPVLVERGILRRMPTDPWGREFLYAVDARGPIVRTLGADGRPGGRAHDADWDNRSIDAPAAECEP